MHLKRGDQPRTGIEWEQPRTGSSGSSHALDRWGKRGEVTLRREWGKSGGMRQARVSIGRQCGGLGHQMVCLDGSDDLNLIRGRRILVL
jgi:hypothetical protein